MQHQLKHAPEDFFVDELSKHNVLRPSLEVLVSKLEKVPADIGEQRQIALQKKASNLKRFMSERFDVEVCRTFCHMVPTFTFVTHMRVWNLFSLTRMTLGDCNEARWMVKTRLVLLAILSSPTLARVRYLQHKLSLRIQKRLMKS